MNAVLVLNLVCLSFRCGYFCYCRCLGICRFLTSYFFHSFIVIFNFILLWLWLYWLVLLLVLIINPVVAVVIVIVVIVVIPADVELQCVWTYSESRDFAKSFFIN